MLELEAESGWLGTARIALKVRRWGRNTLVIIDEHPLRGPAAKLHNTAIDVFVVSPHHARPSGGSGREDPKARTSGRMTVAPAHRTTEWPASSGLAGT